MENAVKKPKRRIRVIIADDHPLVRDAIRRSLACHKDIEFLGEAIDGEQAVKLSSELKPDIVIMDIMMPKLSGVEATRKIKEISPTTSVLILTAYESDELIIGLLEMGVSGYLLKSACAEELIQAIKAINAGESVLHPQVIAKILRSEVHKPSEDHQLKERPISDRELEILKLVARGMNNKEIARELIISVPTVKAHLSRIFNKLAVSSRTEAIMKGLGERWITLEDLPIDKGDSYQASLDN